MGLRHALCMRQVLGQQRASLLRLGAQACCSRARGPSLLHVGLRFSSTWPWWGKRCQQLKACAVACAGRLRRRGRADAGDRQAQPDRGSGVCSHLEQVL